MCPALAHPGMVVEELGEAQRCLPQHECCEIKGRFQVEVPASEGWTLLCMERSCSKQSMDVPVAY